MKEQNVEYLFHPGMEVFRCSAGVLSCYIMGNKISLFERSIDSDFLSFIGQYRKKPFSGKNMESFFSERNKNFNFGNIIYKMKKARLIRKAAGESISHLVLINFTDFSNENFLSALKEFSIECRLMLINAKDKNPCEELNDINTESQVIFVISDFKNKAGVSELNLYFFKKGIYWCPVMIDRFGGYIGPLLHSVPAGPCFNCYEEKLYLPDQETAESDKLPELSNLFLRTALLEMLKISANIAPSQAELSHLLEIDSFNHRSKKHYIYTNSNCEVCGL